jgi:membrane-associated protease RseP (regulator of RpoE activity)
MRTSILTLAASVVLLAAFSARPCAADPRSQIAQVFGFPSEDWGGGSSYLGVDTRDVTPDRLQALHLKEEHGVEVTMVDQDAPAGKAGVKEQDVILTLNGQNIESVEQLRRMIRETPPGRVVALGVSRSGSPMTIKVTLADRKRAFAYSFSGPDSKEFHFSVPPVPPVPAIPPMDFDIPVSIVVAHSSARSGLMVESISPQLGEYFGAKDGNGVLVRSVEKGSLAEKAGLKAGDVITKINGQSIHDASDFTHALRSSRKETTATIGILRDKKEQTVTLKLPERRQGTAIFDESFDIPEMKADTEEALADINSEMADLKPQLQEAINKEMAELRPEMERQKKEFAKQQEKLKKQLCDMQKQWHEHQSEMQKEWKEELKWDFDDSRI